MAPSLLRVLALAPCFHWAVGVTTSGDPDDAKWIVSPTDYPYFVSLAERGNCAGAIVGQRHVATAAHCLCPTPRKVETLLSSGAIMFPSRAFFNPDCMFSCDEDGPNRCDVAIMEFAEDISDSSTPIAVYSASDEVGQELTILGYGNTGDAADGACEEGDGKMRRATNVVTSVDGSPGGVIKYVMDQSGLALEGMAQDGDSGGPAVITSGGVDFLAGVNSGTAENNPCDYGSVDQYCRLSAHSPWIAKVLNLNDNTLAPDIIFENSAKASAAFGRADFYTFLAMVSLGAAALK